MKGYTACVGVAGGQLGVAEISQVSSVVLVEALEAVVNIDWCLECVGESESNLAI